MSVFSLFLVFQALKRFFNKVRRGKACYLKYLDDNVMYSNPVGLNTKGIKI